ncbi:leucine-rich repeat and transmembrane domain-containing protein 1 [Echinops telfairi]|uniref:Leucine-rich repeat and transmembrane domain-containing protein 1 n=1 Tax=Echinops telfairi TaxID=9371 RepID=A0ABM0ZQA7_ECHTE|nr:leucine-rich repeat and transmembrane domain-containing protein 1 [Echinops telfairi]
MFLLPVAWGCPEKCHCHSKAVDCSQQGLAEIPSGLPPHTRTLHLQDNRIRQLPAFAFRSVPRLLTLNLSNNSLSTLAPGAFHGLQHLHTLNLTQNSLYSLEKGLFHSLPRLRELDLSWNNISHLPVSLGEPWGNLTVLAVQQNQLQQLDPALLECMPGTSLLLLQGNLWKCNCHLLGLKLWLERFIYKGGRTDGVTCVSPDTWKGKDLLTIPHDLYLPCPSPWDPPASQSQPPHPAHGAALGPPEGGPAGGQTHLECELKPKLRPTNLRHALATVVITGIVCGIVSLMMLVATIYGCTYAALSAQCQESPLPPAGRPGKTEMGGGELLDSSPV